MSIAYIFKSSKAATLFLGNGPKSIAPAFSVVWYHISNLKSIGETDLKIPRSQVGRTEGRADGRPDGRTVELKDGRTDDRYFYVLSKLRLRRTISIKSMVVDDAPDIWPTQRNILNDMFAKSMKIRASHLYIWYVFLFNASKAIM